VITQYFIFLLGLVRFINICFVELSMEDEFDFTDLNEGEFNLEIPNSDFSKEENKNPIQKIGQEQVFDLITKGEDLSWQAIIFDLVRTEQLDPWNIDIAILADRYMVVIQQMEEMNFFVSSKVLHACALLLRLKSEILVNRDLPALDEALYGKKEETKPLQIKIEIDEDELPLLIPKTPLPRSRRVSLQELMSALNQAIETENRRIRKEIKTRQAQKATDIVMPHLNRIPLKDRIKIIYDLIKQRLVEELVEMKYSELAPSREEKISSFLPVLHLNSESRLHLHQPQHFEDFLLSVQKIPRVSDEYRPYSIKEDKIREEHFENLVDEEEEETGFGKGRKKKKEKVGEIVEDKEIQEDSIEVGKESNEVVEEPKTNKFTAEPTFGGLLEENKNI